MYPEFPVQEQTSASIRVERFLYGLYDFAAALFYKDPHIFLWPSLFLCNDFRMALFQFQPTVKSSKIWTA